jgi:hypothetical protein
MQIADRKSFVAGVVVLIMFVRTLYLGTHSHASAQHTFTLVLYPIVSALCFWHAFEGRRPLLGRSEFFASMFLGVVSLLLAAAHTFFAARYGHKTFSLLSAILFYAAAAFYFLEALRERRSSPTQNYS